MRAPDPPSLAPDRHEGRCPISSINSSKQALSATCSALITGLTALTGADTVTSGGTTYTKAQLLAPLLAYVPLPAQTATAKTAYTRATAAEAVARDAAFDMIEHVIKPYLQSRLGKSSPELETYGLSPVKVAQPTAATKAAAAQKSQATRKALGTKGTTQKKAAKKAIAATPATPAPAKS
jgi:hypothetical protein